MQPLNPPKSAKELLDMYYLEMRCHLLETAAAFDRLERARGAEDIPADARMVKLLAALDILRSGPDKARRFLELFSEE